MHVCCKCNIFLTHAAPGKVDVILDDSGKQVYAYSVAFGRQLGNWAAHDDTVACLQLLTGEQLVTASWDCSVKLWRRAVSEA